MLIEYKYSFQNTQYTVGDPTFEFIVRPHENKKVTFESRKFAKSFLSVDQSAAVSVREMPPDSSEVQFVLRVQVHTCTYVYMSYHRLTYFVLYMYWKQVHVMTLQVLAFLVLYSTEQALHCALSENYFSLYTQRFNGPYTTQIACPFGRPSLVVSL